MLRPLQRGQELCRTPNPEPQRHNASLIICAGAAVRRAAVAALPRLAASANNRGETTRGLARLRTPAALRLWPPAPDPTKTTACKFPARRHDCPQIRPA